MCVVSDALPNLVFTKMFNLLTAPKVSRDVQLSGESSPLNVKLPHSTTGNDVVFNAALKEFTKHDGQYSLGMND